MDSGYQFREGSLKAFQKHHEEDREQDGHKDKNDRKRNHPLQCAIEMRSRKVTMFLGWPTLSFLRRNQTEINTFHGVLGFRLTLHLFSY